jgi:hypothetical protein
MVWTAAPINPAVEPDTNQYIWDPDGAWSDFRDPFIYRQDDQWHVLVTAKKWYSQATGVLFHGVSDDLKTWTDPGPLFANDGVSPQKVLESPQYHQIGDWHHLLFGEFDDQGITLLSAQDPSAWTMDDRIIFDYGYAPEVDEFDPGHRIFSRLAPFYQPNGVDLSYVIRLDTLLVDPDGGNPALYKPSPLDENWVVHSGVANLGNPIFGDNPVWRGEPSVGLVGNGYYSSIEYFQGPLSGKGSAGTQLGVGVKGLMESRRFVIEGNRMSLMVGGGNYPTTCYVALVDSADSTIIFSETGSGDPLMTERTWDLTDHFGKTCYITIVDDESGPMGYLNVDEIIEYQDVSGVLPQVVPTTLLADHTAQPNPFNPRTEIRFTLGREAVVNVRVHDLRGHVVWQTGQFAGRAGDNARTWNGVTSKGQAAPAGTYLYAIEVDGRRLGTGKLSLVK